MNGSRVGTAKADLVLAADPIVAATPEALRAAGRDRSTTIMNGHISPTAEIIRDRDVDFDLPGIARLLGQAARTVIGFDAHGAATKLLGDAIYANMVLLGFAWQKGLVPVTADAIAKAIALNGAAVDTNQRAFAWGRLAAHDPAIVMAEAGLVKPVEPEAESLEMLVDRRAEFLTAYQDRALAARYRALVERVRSAEAALTPGAAGLAAAVARYYFKLLASKDEYEVARLYTDGSFRKALEQEFEGDLTLEFHLAPPLFAKPDPITGRPKKRRFGGWTMGLFRLLASLRGLRGTPLDLFGHTEERRMERRLIAEYETLVDELIAGLSPANHAVAVALATLPDQIRGFGPVKQASVKITKAKEAELRAAFHAQVAANEAA